MPGRAGSERRSLGTPSLFPPRPGRTRRAAYLPRQRTRTASAHVLRRTSRLPSSAGAGSWIIRTDNGRRRWTASLRHDLGELWLAFMIIQSRRLTRSSRERTSRENPRRTDGASSLAAPSSPSATAPLTPGGELRGPGHVGYVVGAGGLAEVAPLPPAMSRQRVASCAEPGRVEQISRLSQPSANSAQVASRHARRGTPSQTEQRVEHCRRSAKTSARRLGLRSSTSMRDHFVNAGSANDVDVPPRWVGRRRQPVSIPRRAAPRRRSVESLERTASIAFW